MKKKINKKIRALRAPVLRMAFQPLFSSSCALHDRISDLHDFISPSLHDVHYDLDLLRQTYISETAEIKARLSRIERGLYFVAFFVLIVLMFI